MPSIILFVTLYVLVMGGTAVFLGRKSQRPFILRFLLGLMLGPIGWLICFFMKPPLTPEEAAIVRERFVREQAQLEADSH